MMLPVRAATVLIIDDDEAMRALARAMLSRHRVLQADSVAAGLEVLSKEQVDLVLLDVMMPGMDGLAGCRLIKLAATGFLPVLLFSANTFSEDVVQGLEAGADDFIGKPLNRLVLNLRVETFLRIRRQQQEIARHLSELHELVLRKDEIVEILVHDLRSPLTVVACSFRAIKDAATGGKIREDAQMGIEATERVICLADDLLTVRLLETGDLAPILEAADPMVVIAGVVESIRPSAAENGVVISVGGTSGMSVPMDKRLLHRAIENLISNAVKYTKERVEVAVCAVEGGVDITISDHGIGIPDALKSSLFAKYGSIELGAGNARRGVGLGLYMAQKVAAAHHGAICVEDRAGGGTTFRLRLSGRTSFST